MLKVICNVLIAGMHSAESLSKMIKASGGEGCLALAVPCNNSGNMETMTMLGLGTTMQSLLVLDTVLG